jgi:hypothetical protein
VDSAGILLSCFLSLFAGGAVKSIVGLGLAIYLVIGTTFLLKGLL